MYLERRSIIAWFQVLFNFFFCTISEVKSDCAKDRLLLYQVRMETHWSKTDFPKDYPKFRPPAQWSKLVGRTHDADFSLYRVGSFASPGLKKFAESGNSAIIDTFSQGTTGVCDAFTARPILKGVGRTETQFFADGNHSKVSLIAKIIPSPDWFVGVDSLDLCLGSEGEWVQSLSINVDAMDGGTDNGYTFTAPKWPSLPQEAIYQITASHPSHPAASFFYPGKERHRPIATFTFTKLKEYSLWPNQAENQVSGTLPGNPLEPNDRNRGPHSWERSQNSGLKKRRIRKLRGSGLDCTVSNWTDWSDCTSKTCDLSEQYRTRSVVSRERLGGSPCPPLLEKRICTSDKACHSNLFDW